MLSVHGVVVLLAAHRTTVISTVTFTDATTAQVTFTVDDTTHAVLTDHVMFPCPSLSGESSGLAATGAALNMPHGERYRCTRLREADY
jgi:hypothetical protein